MPILKGNDDLWDSYQDCFIPETSPPTAPMVAPAVFSLVVAILANPSMNEAPCR